MLKRILRILDNRYTWASIAFLVWMIFFDRYNISTRIGLHKELKNAKDQKEYYLTEIDKDRHSIEELSNDTASLEKFAREKYLMKKDDEDIFLIMDEKKK